MYILQNYSEGTIFYKWASNDSIDYVLTVDKEQVVMPDVMVRAAA